MTLSVDRAEILRLRARVVVLEHAVLAALELVLRVRPEGLDIQIEQARSWLGKSYRDPDFAIDVSAKAEREFLSGEVERLLRGLQSDLGFRGGAPTEESS